MADFYKKIFNTDSIVIAYGANIHYSKNPELIKNWHLDKKGYYLVVGRLIPDNNSDIIVREFLKSNSKKKLVIVGDVPYKDKYAEKIKSLNDDRLIFTGYITDQDCLTELFCNCFAYIHGHEFGGTNPTMLQAMASGCAVLALDTQFTREMCDNEKHAVYFTKKEGHLKQIIENIENDYSLLEKLKETSRNRIIENYTWDHITDQYLTLFNKMLNRQ
jgi:glycosyltransferase involved in cell wall biosynthesis